MKVYENKYIKCVCKINILVPQSHQGSQSGLERTKSFGTAPPFPHPNISEFS